MSGKGSHTPMTGDAAARVQAEEAKAGTGGVKSGDFAARAQASSLLRWPLSPLLNKL